MAERDADTEMITSAVLEVQAHTQVAFGGRQRNMAESQLDLFQASPALMSQPGECSAQVMGRDVEPDFRAIAPNDMKYGLRRQSVAHEVPRFIQRPKDPSFPQAAAWRHSSSTALVQPAIGMVLT